MDGPAPDLSNSLCQACFGEARAETQNSPQVPPTIGVPLHLNDTRLTFYSDCTR